MSKLHYVKEVKKNMYIKNNYNNPDDDKLKFTEECIEEFYKEIRKTKLTILIWGPAEPNKNSPDYHKKTYKKRVDIRNYLRKEGHNALFSEEIQDMAKKLGSDPNVILFEEFQARKADQIIILRTSYGSVGEFHEFWRDESLARKMVVFYDERHGSGFAHQADELFKANGGKVEAFKYPDDIDSCKVLEKVKKRVENIQMLGTIVGHKKYTSGGP